VRLRLIRASFSRRRARLFLAMAAVTMGVGVAITLGTLALRVGDDLARDLRGSGPNFALLPAGATWVPDLGGADYRPARAGGVLDESAVAAMKKTFWKNNILEAAPELVAGARAGEATFQITGTWFEHAVATEDGPWVTGVTRLHPRWTIQGRWPADGAREIALGRELSRRLAAGPGDRIALGVGDARESFEVTGVVRAGGLDDRRAWVPLAELQTLSGRTGEIDRVWFSALVRPAPPGSAPDPASDPEAFEAYMCAAYPNNVAREISERVAGAEARPIAEIVAAEAQVVSRLNLLMLLLALAAVTVSVLGLVSTTTASVVERSVEIGLLRSIGADATEIAVLLLGETAIVSLLGGALGWVLGSTAAAAIRGDVFGAGATFQPVLLPIALALSLLIAVAGTLAPLRLALQLDPAEVLRG
jgi:putative ABC transport system permease protein